MRFGEYNKVYLQLRYGQLVKKSFSFPSLFSFFFFGRGRKLGHATKKKKKKKSVEGSVSDHHEERKTKKRKKKKKKRDASRAEDVNELVLCHKLLVTLSLLN